MNFWANSIQPVASATGVHSRVQLPAVGRIAIAPIASNNGRTLPANLPASTQEQRRGAGLHRAQHRAQCRANCMSKANF